MTPVSPDISKPGDHAELPRLDILSLDDDADFREYIKVVLESDEAGHPDGHIVRTAATPDEFYAHVELRMPDIALVDMKMGRASGEQVLEEIRKRWPRLCVIVVTGYPSMDSMRETFKRDVFDYVAKPFTLDELKRVLGQAVAAYGLGSTPADRLRHELGRQIRLARMAKGEGWTLKDLSEASGVSVSQLSSIERGSHMPSLESLVAIAQALEAKPSDWLANAGL